MPAALIWDFSHLQLWKLDRSKISDVNVRACGQEQLNTKHKLKESADKTGKQAEPGWFNYQYQHLFLGVQSHQLVSPLKTDGQSMSWCRRRAHTDWGKILQVQSTKCFCSLCKTQINNLNAPVYFLTESLKRCCNSCTLHVFAATAAAG